MPYTRILEEKSYQFGQRAEQPHVWLLGVLNTAQVAMPDDHRLLLRIEPAALQWVGLEHSQLCCPQVSQSLLAVCLHMLCR